MKKVLMVGPAKNVKGGMTTVIKQYLNSSLKDEFDIKYIESINDKNYISKFIKMITGIVKFVFLVKKTDIVHIHMASNMSTFRKIKYIKIAKRNRKRVILHIHGGGFKEFYKNCSEKKQKYIRESLNSSDKIIVLSEEWYNYFSKIIDKEKIQVIYNGVELPSNYKKDLRNKNMLFLGRINRQKGIFDLLEVIKELKKKYNDICLYVGGDGEKKAVDQFIEKNGLQNNVKLLGWVSDKEKENILKNSTYFVLPSYIEAMPMSILEAMSYKCVSISTTVGGIPQIIISEKDGFLIEPGDKKQLSETLCTLFNNTLLVKTVSEEARKKIETKFNLQNNIKMIKEIYLGE